MGLFTDWVERQRLNFKLGVAGTVDTITAALPGVDDTHWAAWVYAQQTSPGDFDTQQRIVTVIQHDHPDMLKVAGDFAAGDLIFALPEKVAEVADDAKQKIEDNAGALATVFVVIAAVVIVAGSVYVVRTAKPLLRYVHA